MNDLDLDQAITSSSLTPEQRLEPSNVNLLGAGIETIHDLETLRACVGYENANQQRTQTPKRLTRRGREIRSHDE